MKNLLIVIPTLRMGGAEKSLISLLKALDSKRVNVDLYLFETGGILQLEVPKWVNIIEADVVTRGMTLEIRKYWSGIVKSGHLKAAMIRLWITLQARLSHSSKFSWNLVRKYIPSIRKQYDVAIGYLEGFADFFVLDKVDAKEKIGWIHIDYTGKKLSPEAVEYYSRFDKLVTISDICKKAFLDFVPKAELKISILENIVLPDEVLNKAVLSTSDNWKQDGNYHLVTVGRLDYQKGIDFAARAAKVLKERNIHVCWHVYGQGVMEAEIQHYIDDNKMEDNFVLEGLRENPYPYMKRADLIVQPSRWEGKSIVLDEAKILGKAIVVTAYPSATDQITDRVTGLITGMEPEAIADGIELLLKDEVLRHQLEKNSAEELNHSDRTISRFYNLIDA